LYICNRVRVAITKPVNKVHIRVRFTEKCERHVHNLMM